MSAEAEAAYNNDYGDDDAASKLLIQAYDTLGQPAEALQVALHRSEYVSRQTQTWKELGERFSKQKDAAQAERAFTSIIEVLPNDADSEIALAQVRVRDELRRKEIGVHAPRHRRRGRVRSRRGPRIRPRIRRPSRC